MADPKKINTFCLKTINQYMSCECELVSDDGGLTYSLVPKMITSYKNPKDMHGEPVVAIAMKDATYSLMFNITYAPISGKRSAKDLTDVSLQFYTANEAIAKAEWMNYEYHTDKRKDHPQPHWHLAPKLYVVDGDDSKSQGGFEAQVKKEKELENKVLADKTFELLVAQFSGQINKKLDGIHYAMCGKWVEKGDSGMCIYDLTEENLICWLPYCLKVMSDQLDYIK